MKEEKYTMEKRKRWKRNK